MQYVSTRGAAPELAFEDALLSGLARDGGLYVPAEWPSMAPDAIRALDGLGYAEIVARVIRPFIETSLVSDDELA